MLQTIRQQQRWIVTALVILVGSVFVLLFGPWDLRQSQRVANFPIQVDGVPYSQDQFLRVRQFREQSYRRVLGDSFDAAVARDQLDAIAANEIIQRALLAAEGERLGLHVSDDEVDRVLAIQAQSFRDSDGGIDEPQFRAYVVHEFGSVREFKDQIREDLLVQKMLRLIGSGASVSDAEARASLLYKREQVRIAYVALDPTVPNTQLAIMEGEVDEFLRQSEDRVRTRYDEQIDRFELPERARVRHILFSTAELIPLDEEPSESTLEAARARAEAAVARIEAGEDMAAVARDVSDDLGSKDDGGDLGLVTREGLLDPLEDAAFGLPLGELSPLIESDNGFHVIRVEERLPAETRSFEEARSELAREILVEERTVAWVDDQASALATAVAGGSSLEEAARALGVSIERPAGFRRRGDGYVPGLGEAPEVSVAAFAMVPGQTAPEEFRVGERRVFLQLLEREAPDEIEIEANLEEETERLANEKRQRVQDAWIAKRREKLTEEGRIQVDLSQIR